MLDHKRHAAEVDESQLDDLASELRVFGLLTPTPQPPSARRDELRAAVLARRKERSRAGVGGFRGAALGVAMVAGGGLVIAGAAGSSNPVAFVAEVVRDLPVPETRPQPAERAVETRPAVGALPDASPTREVGVTVGSTPTPLVRGEWPEPTATVERDVAASARDTAPSAPVSGADAKPTDTAPALSAVNSAGPERPTDTLTSNSAPAPAEVKPTSTRTKLPDPVATSTPGPFTETPTVTNGWTGATSTPPPTRTKPTADELAPLTNGGAEMNETGKVAPEKNSRD